MKFGAHKEPSAKSSSKGAPPAITRQSSGLDQFCTTLRNSESLSILDMSGASQANISFITGMGHRISSDDIVGTMQNCFGDDFLQAQQAPSLSQRFLDQTLTFPDAFFDGALVWDALQFLTSPVLEETVAQLLRVMRPGGQMLMFFNANEKAKEIPVYNYRIQDQKTLLQIQRAGAHHQRSQFFNNRNLEKLFQKAASLKFFLTRDHLRELIVRR
ncbi:MAG TPA: class I SAM-dependent methyltransferase [Bryobacteraceae bacterium]|nr:class I SAM-dependent methyltransferase [Bryobacteraceae bacterium]